MQLEHLIRSVLPVILLIIFGFWLQKRHYFSEETVQGVTKLVSDYLIPCTIFTTFIGLDLRPEHFGLAACTFLIQLLLLGLGFLTARLFHFKRRFAPLYPCAFAFGFMALALQLLGIRDAVSATDLGGGVIDTISKLGGISSTLILITVGYRIHMDNPDKIRESLRLVAWRYLLIFSVSYGVKFFLMDPMVGQDFYFNAAFFTLISQHGSVILNAYISEYGSLEDSQIASNAFAINAVIGMALFVLYVCLLPLLWS